MSESICVACEKECAKADALECSMCCGIYHFGTCSDVVDRSLRSKGDSFRKTWKCKTCRTDTQTAKCSHTPDDIALKLDMINAKLEQLLLLPVKVSEMEHSVQVMSDKFDDTMKRLDEQDKQIRSLKKRLDAVEETEVAETQKQLQDAVHDLEWRSRRLNLEIHGIPVTPAEDLLKKLNELTPILAVPCLSPKDVTAIHRLPAKPDKIPGIIVRYSHQSERDMWLAARQKLRAAKHQASILENMTTRNRELLQKTKDWAAVNGFRFAWHSNARYC